jgi:hypothetical protein
MVEQAGHPAGVGLVITRDGVVQSCDEAARSTCPPRGSL